MRRIITLLFALVMIFTMAVPTMAVTPSLTPPSLPNISEIKFDFKFKLPDDYWEKWFNDHPFQLPDDSDVQEPTEVIEPEVTVLGVSTITEARYYHRGYQRLQIQWKAVDDAESYEVEVTKADGTINVYTTNSSILYLTNVKCPRVYVEKTNIWTAASVKVRAVCGDTVGDWSEAVNIGCDALHMG